MATEDRRRVLRAGARYLIATALGGLAVALGLRKGDGDYCDRAGRCDGCGVTDDCDVYQATHLRRQP
jgi:hypothetical protein